LDWEDKFLSGDHSDDEWCLKLLRVETRVDDRPLLFDVVSKIETLQFFDQNNINLLQKDDDGYTLLTENFRPFNLETFKWLANKFSTLGSIDTPENEGITALSRMIKWGKLAEARVLLQNGASVDTFATIARYGGVRLDIPTQAINTIVSLDSNKSQEDVAIEALELLVEFGLQFSTELKQVLLEKISPNKPKLTAWIRSQ
jgi:hypothetical protein